MSNTPTFSNKEFVASAALTVAFQAVTQSIAERRRAEGGNGFMHQSSATYSVSGTTLTATFPAPFEMCYNDFVARAHGTTAGQDTQTYVVNAASLIPGAGSIEVYWYATPATVLQQPFTVVGPPIGHPSYDPNFVPYTAYALTTDTFSVIAGLAVPPGSLEIARGVLTHGSTVVTGFTTANQLRCGAQLNAPTGVLAGSLVTIDQDGRPTFSAAPRAELVYTAGTTVTVPAGVYYFKGRVWGAGGGGGGSNGYGSGGSGGSGGGYSEGVFAVTPGTVLTITVGAGGAGGSNAPTNGTTGGASSIVGFLSANGGGYGYGATNGAAGNVSNAGTASGGSLNIPGSVGSLPTSVANQNVAVGQGGSAFCTPSNLQSNAYTAYAGAPGNFPGGGGTGGALSGPGGAGAVGCVIIEWL